MMNHLVHGGWCTSRRTAKAEILSTPLIYASFLTPFNFQSFHLTWSPKQLRRALQWLAGQRAWEAGEAKQRSL